MRVRYAVILAAVAALALAGCGGGSSGGDPASIVPPGVPLFVEVELKPEGDAAANVEALVKKVAGIEDIGQTAAEALEASAAADKEPLDFAKDVEPWLGNRSGIYLESYDGEEFHSGGTIIETTDTGAAQDFIDERIGGGGESEQDSYEGVKYVLDPEDGQTVGLIGDFLVICQAESSFKAMVDASKGEALADQETYSEATSDLPGESVANVYVDVGGIVAEAGGKIDPEAQAFLATAGIEPKEATAELSLVPGADAVEVDLNSDVISGGPSGDAAKLLESLPGGSLAAFASPDFGSRFEEAVSRLDAEGIPGVVEPGELKSGLEEAGIDLDQIGGSLGDLGLFVEGNTRKNLIGAVVLTTSGENEAANTVANLGRLLRATNTAGVTVISGKLSGFSVPSNSFGGRPIVIAAGGDRIAVATGAAAAAQALRSGQGATLGASPQFQEAVAALGDTPISGYVAGPAALQLATDILSPGGQGERFEEAKPYLEKIGYLAIGSGSSGERATARLIVGLAK